MKTMPLALALILTFLLAACTGRQAPDNDGPTAAASPDAQAEGATRAAPDDDDDDDDAKDHLEVAPDVQKRLGIAVAPVASQPLAIALRATGSVQPIESRLAHVRPLAQGRILDVLVKVGDRVSRGQPLARFDNVEAGAVAAAGGEVSPAGAGPLQATMPSSSSEQPPARSLMRMLTKASLPVGFVGRASIPGCRGPGLGTRSLSRGSGAS